MPTRNTSKCITPTKAVMPAPPSAAKSYKALKPLEMLTRPPLPGSNFFGLGIDVRSGLAQATLFRGALLPLTATCC